MTPDGNIITSIIGKKIGIHMYKVILASVLLVATACATAHPSFNREPKKQELRKHESDGPKSLQVYKYDGSLQCQKESGMAPEKMAVELITAGIPVHCWYQADDGMMRPQVCGSGTGNLNVYQIPAEELSTAVELGFKSVKSLRDFQPQACSN